MKPEKIPDATPEAFTGDTGVNEPLSEPLSESVRALISGALERRDQPPIPDDIQRLRARLRAEAQRSRGNVDGFAGEAANVSAASTPPAGR